MASSEHRDKEVKRRAASSPFLCRRANSTRLFEPESPKRFILEESSIIQTSHDQQTILARPLPQHARNPGDGTGIERIGAHISADKARVDFSHESSIAALFPQIEQEAAALSQADLPIVTALTDEAAQRRYRKVAGLARMACGGTHPRSTAEIGLLKLKRKTLARARSALKSAWLNKARRMQRHVLRGPLNGVRVIFAKNREKKTPTPFN
ncbi:hypothetical protein [Collimonas sp.]|jgi:hypothetical protein|uniref:hypothetical protein n=1 Tax=Collimonas sp. TaxID=1963772 RepID=UPI0037C0998D